MNDDPFAPPESDIRTVERDVGESIWWKIFFFICAILTLLAMVSLAFIDDITMSVYDYIDTAVWFIAVIGLFGFVFSIRLGNARIWMIVFFVVLVEGLFYNLALPIAGKPRFGEVTQMDLWFSVDIGFALAMWSALYLYAFKREYLWKSAK